MMKRMIDRYFALAGGIGFLMVSVLGGDRAASAQTTVPHTFSADTTARANEVNENFKALADAVDNIATGVQGPMGPQGLPGTKGDTGAQGSAGPAGSNGLNGTSGLQGPKGEKGDPGVQGIQGPAGTNGTDGINGTDGSPDTANQVREKFLSGTSCTDPNNPNDIMVKVGLLCIDKYEASVWPSADGSGTQLGATTDNYGTGFPDNGNWATPLYAVSKAGVGVKPSRFITWFQAQQACFLNGKRLLTNAEWQAAAAGTPDPGTDDGSTDCAVLSPLSDTGSRSKCVSKWGVHDMVGNVSEWVADWMQDHSDNDGVGDSSTATFGSDRVDGVDEALPEGDRFPAALIRGGSFIEGLDSGMFALMASRGPSSWADVVGFRCAR